MPYGCVRLRLVDNGERTGPKPTAQGRPCVQENDPENAPSYQCQWPYLADMRCKPRLQFLIRNLTDESVDPLKTATQVPPG